MDVGLGPSHIVLDRDPAPPKGHSSPHLSAMSIVAKRSPLSATAELLLTKVAFPKSIQLMTY